VSHEALELAHRRADGAGDPSLADQVLRFATSGIPQQVLVYGLVSVLALGIDLMVYLGLVHLATRASVAAVAGYGIGLAVHFLLSARVAFDGAATRKSAARLFWQFALSGLCGLAVTAGTVALLADHAGIRPIPAKAVAVILSFALVFLLRRTFVFASSKSG